MRKVYAIRVEYKNGRSEILKYAKHMSKRDDRVQKLRKDRSVKEVVALELWE